MNVLLRYTVAFAAGVLLHAVLTINATVMIGVVATLAVVLAGLLLLPQSPRYLLGVVTLLLFVGLGWLRTPSPDIPADLEQVTAYKAVVSSLPETRAKTYKIEVEIQQVKTQNQWQSRQGKVLIYLDKNAPKPHYGEVLLIRGAPRRVEPPLNPAQFDYQRFLALKQLHFQHYLKATDFVLVAQNQGLWHKKWAYWASDWADAALRRLVPWEREYAVAKAMTLGLRDEMDADLVAAYSAAGAVHVLSVSGFHITVFMWLITWALSRLEKRKYGRWLYLGLTLTILWFYAVLTGLSAPVIRSALMFSLYLLAKPLGKQSSIAHALFGSALLLLATDPLLLYSVSFQLSYAALSGIIFLQPTLYQSLSFKDWFVDKIWAITTVALTAQLATFPVAVYYFHQFPTYFLLANPFVVALGIAMLPVAFVAIALSWIPYLSEALGWVLTGITWLLNETVLLVERLPFSVLEGLSFTWLETLVVYAIIGCLLALGYYKLRPWLWAAAALSAGLLVWQWTEIQQYRSQQIMVVHAVPRHTVVSLIKGQRAVLVADSAFFEPDRKPYNFYLKNFYTQRGIAHVTQEALELPSEKLGVVKPTAWGKIIVWQGRKLLLVEQKIAAFPSLKADVVLVRNTAYKKADDLRRTFGQQPLVFDGTTKWYATDTLQKAAQQARLPWRFVHREGAVVMQR
ncbi:MAG: ComEC family competence protein [Spirosomaceae bacterium]|nr:ComEC family competence protein [Spirosomataceae bacterium]